MPLSPSFPDLASLDLFASVVGQGSLSRAARAHGISQPSASARIRQLERQLGLRLLDRSPTGSVPTASGALVADWAASILAAADELVLGVAALKGSAEAHLEIAASYTVAEHLLPGWLGALRASEQGVGLELAVVNSTEAIERVRAGSADVGFIESPGPTTGLASRRIGADELVVVVWPLHPWTDRRRPLTAAELVAQPLVLREEGSGTRESLDAALAKAGAALPQAAAELGSNAAVRAAVLARTAPAVLSRLAVETELAAGRLVQVPVEGIDLERSLRAVWRRDKPLGKVAAGLVARADLR